MDYKRVFSILKREKTPILVGGTGLYIKAVLYDYKFDQEEHITTSYSNLDDEELYQMLLEVDPNTPIHKNNRKRVERALNYYEIHGKLLSDKEKTDELLYSSIVIGLTTDRNVCCGCLNGTKTRRNNL